MSALQNIRLLLVATLLSVLVLSTVSHAAPVRLKEMAVTTRIVRGKPVDSVHRISHRSVRSLTCYTRGVAGRGVEKVMHVWKRNGRVVDTFDLQVVPSGGGFAVTSTRKVSAADVGEWRVELSLPDGTVVRAVTFRMN